MTELGKKSSGILISISKVLQRLSPVQCPLCHGGTPPGLRLPMETRTDAYGAQITWHVCSWTPPGVSRGCVYVEKAKSYMTANAKLLGLTWPSKQPVSLWVSPEMCVEHP